MVCFFSNMLCVDGVFFKYVVCGWGCFSNMLCVDGVVFSNMLWLDMVVFQSSI